MNPKSGQWRGVASHVAAISKAIVAKAEWVHDRIPYVRNVKWSFITLHYLYLLIWIIVSSVVVYGGSGIPYIDALFFASGAATQSGLNTVDFNLLPTYSQVFLYIVSMWTNPIMIHSFVVFVRLYWFEKRFQHIVRDARALRRTKSRTFTATRGEHDTAREEQGVRGQSIVVLRNENGAARDTEHDAPKSDLETNSDTGSSKIKDGSRRGFEAPEAPSEEDVNEMRLPAQRSPEHHIAFLEHQRTDQGTLRIPSPREYDRGGMPQAIDEGLENPNSPKSHAVNSPIENGNDADNTAGHITINEPDNFRARTRQTTTFPRLESRRTTGRDEENDDPVPLTKNRSRRGTFNGIFRTLTQERERDTMPYLSWNATIGRNSAFIALTEEQREELGGIEYRALKTLAVVLIGYFIGFHLLGLVCLTPWIMNSGRYGSIVTADGQGRPWWGIYTAQSAFNDVGYTLTPDSMNSFQDAIFPLLLMSFLIVIGNTGFPCMLRVVIWAASKITPAGTSLWEELRFLLDHPRRCFTLLFPRNATWWLFAILVILNGLDLIFFIILDLNDPIVTAIPAGIRVLDGLFQAVSTRTAGFGVVSIAELHPAIQVSYMIMMYISVFPIAISMRRTNVYEEKSLGIYGTAEEQEEESKQPSYIGAHLRRQLSFDLWYIFLGLFVIAIVEGDQLQNTNQYAFTLFSVLFEIVSAYGTVGLSLGYPNVNASFSSQFRVISKLVIIAMQIRGRHRGLPYALDRAILLPSESLHKKEQADAERQMRRRGSNLSNMSAVSGSQPRGVFRAETGLSNRRTNTNRSLEAS